VDLASVDDVSPNGKVSIGVIQVLEGYDTFYKVDSSFAVDAVITVDGQDFRTGPFPVDQVSVPTVAEPASLAAMGLPLAAFLGRRRRRADTAV